MRWDMYKVYKLISYSASKVRYCERQKESIYDHMHISIYPTKRGHRYGRASGKWHNITCVAVTDLTRDTLLLNPRHNNNPSKKSI
jgi:hypothetical protein